MIIYFYLLIPLLFVPTDSSSIRGRNNKNDLVPYTSSRSDVERKDGGAKLVEKEPFFLQLQVPSSGDFDARRKYKKKKRPIKKRISKIKPLRKRQRVRREVQTPKPKFSEEVSNAQEILKPVNLTERLQNITSTINRMDILKTLSAYTKELENKRRKADGLTFTDDQTNNPDAPKQTASDLNRQNHLALEKAPMVKMVYPSTPKPDRHGQKYTYKDLITDRDRLEQKIKYIKNMLNVNDSEVDDTVRIRRKSDSDRTANRVAKMFLTLSAVNGLQGRRKKKCGEDDDDDYDDEDRVQDVWEKERRESSSRKSFSSNEERYKVKKWIEFMKNKRSSGKTCPCLGWNDDERDVFPLEQTLPKGYFLMQRRESSEESSEVYGDPVYSYRDKPNRENYSRRRLNKNQDDQESKPKGLVKNGKKKTDTAFTDLEIYRSRAKQILRNAEEILDKIKEEEEKRLSNANSFMSQLREITSRIQGEPRNNENDLIRKLHKNLGWAPLAKSEEGADGNQFMENVKSFILDPYEKAKALTDESAKKLSTYLLRNLGKIQEASEERSDSRETDNETGKANTQVYYSRVPTKVDKPLPDSLAKEEAKPDPTGKSDADKKEPHKQRVEDIIKQQQKILDEYQTTYDSEKGKKEMERGSDKESEMVRENQQSNMGGKIAMQLNEHDTDRNPEASEKEIKSAGELEATADFVEERPLPHPEGTTEEEKGDSKSTTAGNLREDEKIQQEIFEEIMKATREETDESPDDEGKVGNQRSDEQDSNAQIGEMQEIIASSQTTSREIPDRNENDVISSPHLTNDNELLNARENHGDISGGEEPPAGNDPPTTTFEEEPLQTKSNVEAVLENRENIETDKSQEKLDLNQSGALSNLGSKETVGLQDPILEKDLLEKKESISDEKHEEIIQAQVGDIQPLEYEDLVKEVSQASKELLKPDETPMVKSNEEVQEVQENEEFLKMGQTDKENQSGDRTDRTNKSGETVSKIEDPENLEERDNQEDSNDGLLKLTLDENSKDVDHENVPENENVKAAQDKQDQQSIESSDETLLKTENLETPKEDPGEETFLKEALESGATDEVDEATLKAENPTEETDSSNLFKNAGEDDSNETLLKETQNLEGIQRSAGINNDQDEADLREASFEEKSDNHEEEKANKGDDDDTPLKAVQDEDLKEDFETLKLEGPGKENNDYSESFYKVSGKETPEDEEETLRSENVNDGSNYRNQENEGSSQEVIAKAMSEETEEPSEENLKLEKPVDENESKETSAGSPKDQENLEDYTLLKAGAPKEDLNEQTENEDTDKEAILRAENSGLETKDQSEETQTSSQENLERTRDESLQQAISKEKSEEEQSSYETLKEPLENETQEMKKLEGEDTLKAVNAEDNNEKLEEKYSSEDGIVESVKADFNSPEEQDGDEETVKAKTQDNMEDEGLEGETLVEKTNERRDSNEDGRDESVRAALDEENQENLDENDETLKAAKSEKSLEINDIIGEPLKSSEKVDDDESVLKEAKSNEGLKEYEEDLDSKGKAVSDDDESGKIYETQTEENEDETPLRATLSQEQEEETLHAENPNAKEEQKESDYEESQLRSSTSDEGNQIYYESPLRSANPVAETDASDHNMRVQEESPRDMISNEIDENEYEPLRSENFHFGKSSNEDEYKTFMEDPWGKTAAEEPSIPDVNTLKKAELRENEDKLSDLLQMSESLRSSTLKVPKSIGKIMNDLEGRDDLTSLQNLNPDKIDHIIDKIDEAEQNLLENQEVDCRKECACAEELHTKSRNSGRYEIVKDFLQWMKDLQLNRVL